MSAHVKPDIHAFKGINNAPKECVAGHSLFGAAGAIYYAGRVQVDCLITLAPERPVYRFNTIEGMRDDPIRFAHDRLSRNFPFFI